MLLSVIVWWLTCALFYCSFILFSQNFVRCAGSAHSALLQADYIFPLNLSSLTQQRLFSYRVEKGGGETRRFQLLSLVLLFSLSGVLFRPNWRCHDPGIWDGFSDWAVFLRSSKLLKTHSEKDIRSITGKAEMLWGQRQLLHICVGGGQRSVVGIILNFFRQVGNWPRSLLI